MFSILGKSQEERRNREYEVSLVETLKDSYEGVEEIRFSNANYTNPPGSWTCEVELFFNERSIKYKINYSKNDKRISDVSLERENGKEDREFLNSHLGKTSKLTKLFIQMVQKENINGTSGARKRRLLPNLDKVITVYPSITPNLD